MGGDAPSNLHPNQIKHFTNQEDILEYLKKCPQWIAGFAAGEGSFSAYAYFDKANTWGLQFGIDFSISQNVGDRIVLEAINAYFGNVGGVYDRTCGVSVVTFRDIQCLKNVIIPFFMQYYLVGSKSYEFECWSKMVELYHSKEHLGKTLAQRDAFLKYLHLAKLLNEKRFNQKKIAKLDVMIEWLGGLIKAPTKEEKLKLNEKIKAALISLSAKK